MREELYDFSGVNLYFDEDAQARRRNGIALLKVIEECVPGIVKERGIDALTVAKYFRPEDERVIPGAKFEGYIRKENHHKKNSAPHCECLHRIKVYHYVNCWVDGVRMPRPAAHQIDGYDAALGSECIKALTGYEYKGVKRWISDFENYVLKKMSKRMHNYVFDDTKHVYLTGDGESEEEILGLLPKPSSSIYGRLLESGALPSRDKKAIDKLLKLTSRNFFKKNLDKIPDLLFREKFLMSIYMLPGYAAFREREEEVLAVWDKIYDLFVKANEGIGYVVGYWKDAFRIVFSDNTQTGIRSIKQVKRYSSGALTMYAKQDNDGFTATFINTGGDKDELRVTIGGVEQEKGSEGYNKVRDIVANHYINHMNEG